MSSEAVLVAREIQDLASAVEGVASAVREQQTTINVQVPEATASVTVNVPEQAAPSVVVNVPEQSVPAVTVAAPNVEFKPVVNVPKAEPVAYEVTITGRSVEGFITSFVIRPI